MKLKRFLKLNIVFICILISFSCVKLDNPYKNNRLLNNLYVANDDMFANGVAHSIIVPNVYEENTLGTIQAESYFICSTNKFSSDYAKYHNPFKRSSMASLTKLMTALVVLENCKDLNQTYTVSANAVDLEKDHSKANLKEGDKVSVRDLLFGLLIASGNDAATCLAENVFGNFDNFIIVMNNTAERLGALNTHFANANGLDSEFHYSNAYDLFLITRELIKHPIFMEITSLREYTANIYSSNGTIRREKWLNTNLFVTNELPINEKAILLAGKTGNTRNAGNCLILYTKSKKSEDYYISVVLNAQSKRNAYYNTNELLKGIK